MDNTTGATRTGGGFYSPDKKNKESSLETQINFNPEGPMTTDEVMKMQEEINRLRTDSR